MDKKEVVKKIQEALLEIKDERGDFSLVMLLKTEPMNFDRAVLIVSAPWLDRISTKEGLEFIIKVLNKFLTNGDKKFISSIGIVKSSDLQIKNITNSVAVDVGSSAEIRNTYFFDLFIDYGIILASKKTK